MIPRSGVSGYRRKDRPGGQSWRAVGSLVLALTLAGCVQPNGNALAQRSASRWIAALNSHRVKEISALLGADGTYEDAITQRPIAGLVLQAFWSNFWRLYPDLVFSATIAVAETDRVAIEYKSAGTHASGQVITSAGVFVLDVRGDGISRVRAYYDLGVFLRVLSSTQ